jgi:DNA replication protein DnaC
MTAKVLKEQMKQLKLSTAVKEIDEILSTTRNAISFNWIIDLFQREIDQRKSNSFNARIKSSKIQEIKTFEKFDWEFNPQIQREQIEELKNFEFLQRNGIILLLGQPGTGKTHISLSLGLLAIQRGHKVYCTSLKKLINDIDYAKKRNELDSLFKKILSCKLWILDDWGVITMKRDIAEEVFDLLDRRKHSSAMILTSNRDISEWTEVFPDPVLASAALDRVFDRAKTIIFEGRSYRLEGKIEIPDKIV